VTCPACGAAVSARDPFCKECGRAVDDPLLGSVLAGRFQIERRIAIGGFGSIYRATETATGQPRAIKIMHRELVTDAACVARFRREGIVLCKLRDLHVVHTYELGETPDGQLYIVMELLEGETLLDLARSAPTLPWPRVFRVLRGACDALAEAHALGVVHRDLKPSNLFVTAGDVTKVLDFGIAKPMQSGTIDGAVELTTLGTAVGTPEYMAPEQLMGGAADPRTDLYMLGVIGYELVTGRRPFDTAGLDLLSDQLARCPPTPSELARVPPSVDRVLLRCLEADPADRFDSADELARALDAALAGAATLAPTVSNAPAAPFVPAPQPPARPAAPAITPRPMTVRQRILLFLKGMAMGSADVVPGVSGGTIAFISGIYEELLASIRSIGAHTITVLRKDGLAAAWRQINGSFLLTLLAGIGTAVVLLVRPITWALEHQPVLIWSFFFGLVGASVWLCGKKVKRWSIAPIVGLVIGAAAAGAIAFGRVATPPDHLAFYFFAGAIAICAMILPGISGSFILLLMGAYAPVMAAIKGFDVALIGVFAVGCVAGLMAFSRLLTWMFKRHHDLTTASLTGFLLGSLLIIWPWKQVVSVRESSKGLVPFLRDNVLPGDYATVTDVERLLGITEKQPQLAGAIGLMVFGAALLVILERFAPRDRTTV
jgi:putative membrane protein